MQGAVKAVTLLFVVLTLNGCATMTDAIKEKGTGRYRVYENDFDTVWEAALDVVAESYLALVAKDKSEGLIQAERSISLASYGESVAIFVEREDGDSRTRVEVVSKKAVATNLFAKNWEKYILRQLDAKLNL